MIYPSFLNVTVAPSNTGKTQFWLRELMATPPCSTRATIYIYTFDQDTQFDQVELPVHVKSYQDFKVEDIPQNCFVVMDELNTALMQFPQLLPSIQSIFTTRAHHFNLSLVCICQTVLKTPAFPLLRMAHSVTLATQAGSNFELIKHFMYKSMGKALEEFLLRFQDKPYFVTIYTTVPYQYAAFNQVLYLRTDLNIRLYFSLNPSKDMAVLAPEAEKVLRPLLEKGYHNGLAVVPLNLITLSRAGEKKEEDTSYEALERNVREMIDYTVQSHQMRSYIGLWFFVKKEPRLSIDPETLLLSYKEHTMGLQPFLALLLRPSHLHKASYLPKAGVAMTHVLLSNPSFNAHKVTNRKLKAAALKYKEGMSNRKPVIKDRKPALKRKATGEKPSHKRKKVC